MAFFKPKEATVTDEAKNLVNALRSISVAALDEAEGYAWNQHEEQKLTDAQFFTVIRRLRILSGLPSTPMGMDHKLKHNL